MMDRLGLAHPDKEDLQQVATELGFASETGLAAALAVGDCQVSDVVGAMFGSASDVQLSLLPPDETSQMRRFSLEIQARDRAGLLRDVTVLLSGEGISILANSSRLDPQSGAAVICVELLLPGLQEVALILEQLSHVPDVVDVRCAAA